MATLLFVLVNVHIGDTVNLKKGRGGIAVGDVVKLNFTTSPIIRQPLQESFSPDIPVPGFPSSYFY